MKSTVQGKKEGWKEGEGKDEGREKREVAECKKRGEKFTGFLDLNTYFHQKY